jgi:RimJ/RimL family protein N-acetyltransferase
MRARGMKNCFQDGRVGIRRFQADDAAPLYAAARESIQELCHWMVWCHPDYSLDDARTFIGKCLADSEQGTRYSFAIYSQEGGAGLLGSVGLSRVDRTHRLANLGYWVRTPQTGKGVGAAAARLAARFAFEELGLNRLEIIIPVGNRACIRIAEKLEAHFEGLLKKRLMLHGKPCDALGYSLLAEEFNAHQSSI